MRKSRKLFLFTGMALFAFVLSGCSDQDTERLGRIGRKVSEKFDDMTGGADGKLAQSFHAMRANWDDVALDARVMARLRWDKTLADAQIQVSASGGTVELKGTVNHLEQRRRAVELAESTAGVEQVSDLLVIGE